MTRFEYVTRNPQQLAALLDMVHSDGLVAKGCSMKLLLPPTETGIWEDWLGEEYPEEWDDCDRAGELSEMERIVEQTAAAALAEGATE